MLGREGREGGRDEHLHILRLLPKLQVSPEVEISAINNYWSLQSAGSINLTAQIQALIFNCKTVQSFKLLETCSIS